MLRKINFGCTKKWFLFYKFNICSAQIIVSLSDKKNETKHFLNIISNAPTINFSITNYGCGLPARWRSAAVSNMLANTLRMSALLGRIPSCARRRARPGAGACALALAPARERARPRAHMHTLTCICKICKTVAFTKEWIRTVRVRGSGPKSVPFDDPKSWAIFC